MRTWLGARSALLGELDLDDLAGALRKADRTELFDLLGRCGRIAHDERRGLWFLMAHDLCAQVLRDVRFSSDTRNATVVDAGVEVSEAFGGSELPVRPYLFFDPPPYVAGRPFLFADPPDHTRLRRLVSKAFTPRVVEGLRPRVETLVDELLSDVQGEFDLVETLAYPLPLRIITELLGVADEHFGFVREAGASLAGSVDADCLRTAEQRDAARLAQFQIGAFFSEQADMRRAAPGDDLLTALTRAEDQGDRLTPFELVATALLLLLAGHETTVNLIGNGVTAFSRHPDQIELLRTSPNLAASAVEEALRYEPPVQLIARTALEDVDLDDVRIPAGGHVILVIPAANRDPAQFSQPNRFDIRRPEATRHLSFGFGLHHCLGAPLARLETEVAYRELARRYPRLEIAEPVIYRDDVVLRGARELRVIVA